MYREKEGQSGLSNHGWISTYNTTCRNLVIPLMYREDASHIAASRRFFSYHPRSDLPLVSWSHKTGACCC